ncbi:Acetylcholinesterase-1 like protein [Argiope bruennichi]|uniref:Carboxylic ester hydrolase n=1 Tax=Argiope bruennichi TaxID=94029 RepID=A0A8T0DY87_ARGBR|nr:Acetylcholinesterase-1 like protein [Argiope bruennichi]
MKIAPFFITVLIFGATSSCCLGKIVHTPSGPIQGFFSNINNDLIEIFLGIPFAEPPVGNLRFRKPVPVKPWTRTLLATKIPPACIQYTPYPFPWADFLPGKSEDCLYLNIYVPVSSKNGSKLAVLFWIHGGGLTYGSNRKDIYDARALASHGDVIVVTINYRLGVLGFLTSNTEDAPGNVGLYDILIALQWVNDNIESFGGDKNRITVHGQSAGSIAISILCISPLAKGLFSRAILQSGTIILVNTNQVRENLAISQRLAETVGCASRAVTIENDPKSVVDCLRNRNATDLALVIWSFNPTSTRSFLPQYGDDLIPRNALDEIRNGNFYNVSLLIGNTRDEGSFQIATRQPELFGFCGQKNPILNRTQAENITRNIFRNFDNPEKYVKYYLSSIPDDHYDALKRQVYTASGDTSLLCTNLYFAESYADRNNDVYYYFFTHRPSNTPWAYWMGVAHFEDVQFVFGRPIRKPYLYEPIEVELSKKMIEIWANFAKNG